MEMVMQDYVNRNTKPSWQKRVARCLRKHREPLLLLSIVLLASLAGSI